MKMTLRSTVLASLLLVGLLLSFGLSVRAQQVTNTDYEHDRSAEAIKRDKRKDNNNVEDVLRHGYGTSWQIDLALTGRSHNVACGLGGDVRATEGCLTRLRVPSPQPFQTTLPEAVPPGPP